MAPRAHPFSMRCSPTGSGCITISLARRVRGLRIHKSATMHVVELCHWLQNTPFATGLRQSDLLFPLIEGSHILASSVSVGLIITLDLRLLRLALCGEPVSRVMHQVMPWALPGFAVMFVTGLLLFVAQAEKVYTNTFFRYKVLFLVIAGFNALYYQMKFY